MRSSQLTPLFGLTLLLASAAACRDQETLLEPDAGRASVSAFALPDPEFTVEWGFDSMHPLHSARLLDAFAVAPGLVWAVGDSGMVALSENGDIHPGPRVPGNGTGDRATLRGVWGSSSSNVLAVGIRSPSTGPRGRVFHYNGSAWTEEQVTADQLYEVWGVSPTLAYAVGTEIVRWNGTSSTGVYGPTGVTFFGVWASGPNDVFAVGTGGTIVHFNGTSWQVQPTPTRKPLNGVWGFGPNDVWAVGSGGAILHYDGTSWTSVGGGGGYTLSEVWGSDADSVMAAGFDPATGRSVLVRFDGAAWTADPGFGGAKADPDGLGRITAITGFSADDYFVATEGVPTMWRVVGGATRRVKLNAVHGFAGGPVFAVGDSGVIVQRSGGRWRTMSTPTLANLATAYGSSATNLVAGGYNPQTSSAAMLRYDGIAWTPVALPVGNTPINALWGARDTLWGGTGLVTQALYRPGPAAAWQLVTTHNEIRPGIADLHGLSTRNFFAVTTAGQVWRYNGVGWNRTLSFAAFGDAAVWADGQAVWAAGTRSLYRRGTDGSWVTLLSGLAATPTVDLGGTAPDDVFMVRGSGTVWRWDGSTLRALSQHIVAPLAGVWTSPSAPSDVWTVGGTLIYHGRR